PEGSARLGRILAAFNAWARGEKDADEPSCRGVEGVEISGFLIPRCRDNLVQIDGIRGFIRSVGSPNSERPELRPYRQKPRRSRDDTFPRRHPVGDALNRMIESDFGKFVKQR